MSIVVRADAPGTHPQLRRWRAFYVPVPVAVVVALSVSLALGVLVGLLGTRMLVLVGIGIAIGLISLFRVVRQDEVMAAGIIVISLLIDWYRVFAWHLWLGLPNEVPIVSALIAAMLVIALALRQSRARPWVPIPLLPLWGGLLVLAALAIGRASHTIEASEYYVNVFVNAFLMFVIGTQISRNMVRIRKLLNGVAIVGTLVAMHTILYVQTGVFLLATTNLNDYLASKANFPLQWADSPATRAGSFLLNPDWNGAFLAMAAFLPMGLFIHASSAWARMLYLVEAALILLALLYTYSAASWISLFAGLIVFGALTDRGIRRVQLAALTCAGVLVALYVFPTQSANLIQHGSATNALQLRESAWQTAIRVINAYPWVGTGLGNHTYLERAAPYDVPLLVLQQRTFVPLNSYLEVAAMAGLVVGIVFLAVLGRTLWSAWRNWVQADGFSRPLLGGALAALTALSVNSFAIPCWTLPPLAAIAWLIAGALSSPSLAHARTATAPLERVMTLTGNGHVDGA